MVTMHDSCNLKYRKLVHLLQRHSSKPINSIHFNAPSLKKTDCTRKIFERSKNSFKLLYITSTWKIYQSTTHSRLRNNASHEFLLSSFFFEANPSSKLKALMRQVPKQKQVKLQCFSFYQIEKTTGQKQLPAPSHNFNSRRANCRKIHET